MDPHRQEPADGEERGEDASFYVNSTQPFDFSASVPSFPESPTPEEDTLDPQLLGLGHLTEDVADTIQSPPTVEDGEIDEIASPEPDQGGDPYEADVMGTQPFTIGTTQRMDDEEEDEIRSPSPTPHQQLHESSSMAEDNPFFGSTQPFMTHSAEDTQDRGEDEGTDSRQIEIMGDSTQAFDTFEEADRIIAHELEHLQHTPASPGQEEQGALGPKVLVEPVVPDPILLDTDPQFEPGPDQIGDETQEFQTFQTPASPTAMDSELAPDQKLSQGEDEDIQSPTYPVPAEEAPEDEIGLLSTQPFDGQVDDPFAAGPSSSSLNLMHDDADFGPRSPSPEGEPEPGLRNLEGGEEVEEQRRIDDDEDIGPKSPTGEGSDYGPPKSPDSNSSGDEDKQSPRKRRVILSDDDEDEDEDKKDEENEPKKAVDGEVAEEDALIADIFGEEPDSDAEEGETATVSKPVVAEEKKDSGDSDDEGVSSNREWDFDVMMRKKKAEKGKRRRKNRDGGYDLLSDADEYIKELVGRMKDAAEEDRKLKKDNQPALRKRSMLKFVVNQLLKADLKEALLDFGIITAIAEWLAPLPDRSLPSLEIRTQLLKILQTFHIEHSILRTSGIGKAVMILYKHPKETKTNREVAGKLIGDWSRPIFDLDTDYRNLTKEDREKRDYDHMPQAKKRRLSQEAGDKAGGKEEEKTLRPGDKGWIGRARVPRPSTKDYVVRPKHKVEGEFKKTGQKKSMSQLDRKLRDYKDKVGKTKQSHAITVSIEGRKMPV